MINVKSNKGVTMVALVITVIIVLLILSVMGYSTMNGLAVKRLNNMYADIRTLEEKIAVYYLEYGDIPKKGVIEGYSGERNINDNNVYYEIDISKLENISLSNVMQNGENRENMYIINEQSHTIYYAKGVTVDKKTYYTIPLNYEKVDLSEYQ